MQLPTKKPTAPPPGEHHETPGRVRPDDFLKKLDVLHQMLRVLNEPLAGAPQIAHHVERFPVLAARVAARFSRRFQRPLPSVKEQIALLGNRDFEALLLELLEDLTVLKSDLDVAASTAPPAK